MNSDKPELVGVISINNNQFGTLDKVLDIIPGHAAACTCTCTLNSFNKNPVKTDVPRDYYVLNNG